ncbi:hypothetical protein ACOSQ3_030155 [Xanthoceras sorbifolium]
MWKPSIKLCWLSSCSLGPDGWWKKLWLLQIPSKIKIFAWRAFKDILPTLAVLFKRDITGTACCSYCTDAVENVDHVLWSCVRIQSSWQTCPLFSVINALSPCSFMDRVVKVESLGGKNVVLQFIVAAWFAWNDRNLFVFGGKFQGRGDCWNRAAGFLFSYRGADVAVHNSHPMLVEKGCWVKPGPDIFKLNVDAAVVKGNDCFGMGIVIRDDSGMPVLAASVFELGCVSAEIAEAKAILEGFRMAAERNMFPLEIESDALNVVRLCRQEDFTRSDLDNVIQDIQELLFLHSSASIRFIPRDLNCMADTLAKNALRLNCSSV